MHIEMDLIFNSVDRCLSSADRPMFITTINFSSSLPAQACDREAGTDHDLGSERCCRSDDHGECGRDSGRQDLWLLALQRVVGFVFVDGGRLSDGSDPVHDSISVTLITLVLAIPINSRIVGQSEVIRKRAGGSVAPKTKLSAKDVKRSGGSMHYSDSGSYRAVGRLHHSFGLQPGNHLVGIRQSAGVDSGEADSGAS